MNELIGKRVKFWNVEKKRRQEGTLTEITDVTAKIRLDSGKTIAVMQNTADIMEA